MGRSEGYYRGEIENRRAHANLLDYRPDLVNPRSSILRKLEAKLQLL